MKPITFPHTNERVVKTSNTLCRITLRRCTEEDQVKMASTTSTARPAGMGDRGRARSWLQRGRHRRAIASPQVLEQQRVIASPPRNKASLVNGGACASSPPQDLVQHPRIWSASYPYAEAVTSLSPPWPQQERRSRIETSTEEGHQDGHRRPKAQHQSRRRATDPDQRFVSPPRQKSPSTKHAKNTKHYGTRNSQVTTAAAAAAELDVDLPSCPFCVTEYDTDLFLLSNETNKLPVSCRKCSYTFCYSCLLKEQQSQSERHQYGCSGVDVGGDVQMWLHCPSCKHHRGFSMEHPVQSIHRPFCDLLAQCQRLALTVKEAQAQASADAATTAQLKETQAVADEAAELIDTTPALDAWSEIKVFDLSLDGTEILEARPRSIDDRSRAQSWSGVSSRLPIRPQSSAEDAGESSPSPLSFQWG